MNTEYGVDGSDRSVIAEVFQRESLFELLLWLLLLLLLVLSG